MNDNHLLAKIGQYALISNNDNKILLLERMHSKTWCLPGGRLDNDEDWDDALLREIKEELNLECENPKPVAVNILTDEYQTKYCVYFSLTCVELSSLRLSDEHSDYKWVGLSELDDYNVEDEKVKKIIIDYLG